MIRLSFAPSISDCAMSSGPLSRRIAAPYYDLLQLADHTNAGQRRINIDAQALTIVIVDYIEGSERAAIAQGVTHEVHRPHLVSSSRYAESIRLVPLDASSRFDPQVQLQLLVQAVYTLVIPGKSTHVTQMQKAQPESPSSVGCREAQQSVDDHCILRIQLRTVAVARFAHALTQACEGACLRYIHCSLRLMLTLSCVAAAVPILS